MIIEQNDLTNYETLNKIYIPNTYNNQNYQYNFNGDYIIIRTNQNCRTNYNTQYCDCYSYNYKNNVISDSYECNVTSGSSQTINYNYITSNINDSTYIRERFMQDKSLMIYIFILGLLIALFLTKEKRFL